VQTSHEGQREISISAADATSYDVLKMRTTLSLTATIEIVGVNPYVLVSMAQVAVLKSEWRRPMPVLVKINGEPKAPWRTNMMPNGRGDFLLYLHVQMRDGSGTKVGDVVTIDLTFDESYRNGPQHSVPESLQVAFDGDETVASNWSKLTPSRQKEILRYFAALKTQAAKERNVERMVRVLGGDAGRFMGRDWLDGQ
jgi:hypothetical protein